jgi:Tfp pilus assembly PilM family ATPase
MQREDLRSQYRNSARATVRASRQDNQSIEIAILSLAGLTLTLFEIAQYAGSAVLPQMFAF